MVVIARPGLGGLDGLARAVVAGLKMVHQGGRDVGRTETFFKEDFNEAVVPFVVAGLESGAEFIDKSGSARFFDFGG